jgi:TrmH family RNA methyltransferase
MEKISMLGSGSRIAAVFSFFDRPIASETSFPGKLPLIYLAGISDPGNLGTIIRSATALGATGILLDPDTADPYGHKAIRASMGAMFSIPLYIGIGIGEMVKLSKRLQRAIICADSQEGAIAWDVDLSGAYILAFGSERSGIPAAIGAASAYKVRIPQLDRKTDSINVAMAATAILYEAARQRSSA